MVCEAYFKNVGEKNLDVAHFTNIFDDFLSNAAPFEVCASEVTVHMMKMCIEFMDDLAPARALLKTAQMEVYPLLVKDLTGDLEFISDLLMNQFTQIHSNFIESEKLASAINFVLNFLML